MRSPEELTDAELMLEILRRTGWKNVELEDRKFYQEVKGVHPVYAHVHYAGEWLLFGAKGRLEEMLVKVLPVPQQVRYAHVLSNKVMGQTKDALENGENDACTVAEECGRLKTAIGEASETELLRAYAMLAATPRDGAEALYSVLMEEEIIA